MVMISSGHGKNRIMNEELMTIIITFVFLLVFIMGTGYTCYLVWFNFSEVQAKLLKRNQTDKKWSMKNINTLWINHWSYKWFARIIALILFMTGFVILATFLYEFLA